MNIETKGVPEPTFNKVETLCEAGMTEFKAPKEVIKEIQGSKMYLNLNDQGLSKDLIFDGIREEKATSKMNKNYKNPALEEEPIGEPASIITPRENESLFRWIKSTGRFMPNQSDSLHNHKGKDELEDILDQEEGLNEEE